VIVPGAADSPPDIDELKLLVGERLAHFKVPTVFEFVGQLPRNPSGKLLRRQLQSMPETAGS
jgi:fatty-acyl-CoA synthase